MNRTSRVGGMGLFLGFLQELFDSDEAVCVSIHWKTATALHDNTDNPAPLAGRVRSMSSPPNGWAPSPTLYAPLRPSAHSAATKWRCVRSPFASRSAISFFTGTTHRDRSRPWRGVFSGAVRPRMRGVAVPPIADFVWLILSVRALRGCGQRGIRS